MRPVFSQAILTWDIRHAQEGLWLAGRPFHPEGRDALRAWVEPLEGRLDQRRGEELRRRLGRELGRVSRRGVGTKGKRPPLGRVIDSLRKRVKPMDSESWRRQDLVIALGVVAGAARSGVGARLDNSGIRWIKERAAAVLRRRCLEVNGDWEDFLMWSQEQRSQELRRGEVVENRRKTPTQLPQAAGTRQARSQTGCTQILPG